MTKTQLHSADYQINGMHCANCELFMQLELCKIPNVKAVKADATAGQVQLEFTGDRPSEQQLHALITEYGYQVVAEQTPRDYSANTKNLLLALVLAIAIGLLFLGTERASTNIFSDSKVSGILTYLLLGIAASLSSCAALVGGLILSFSNDWNSNTGRKPFPQLQFHLGRLTAFIILGGLLGLAGTSLQLSMELTVALVVITSFAMIVLGLQMLNIFPTLNKLQLKLPGNLGGQILAKSSSSARFSPLLIGIGTFLLPCGFTLTAQAQALSSGSFTGGALIMGAFAIGTLPVLLIIGLSARYFTLNKNSNDLFLKTAGIVVILFALFTINNQLNVLGLPSITDILLN